MATVGACPFRIIIPRSDFGGSSGSAVFGVSAEGGTGRGVGGGVLDLSVIFTYAADIMNQIRVDTLPRCTADGEDKNDAV